MTDLTTQQPAASPDPDDAPGPPEAYEGPPVDVPPADGVELSRLIGLARLTPPQALEIAAGVLADAAQRSAPVTGIRGSSTVVVGGDGRAVLGATPDVEAALADVAAAARSGARRDDPAAEQLLAELDRAERDLPVAGVTVVARRVQEAAAAIDRGAVRAELGALARAVGGLPGPGGGAAPAIASATTGRAAPASRSASGGSRAARRRIGAWLLSVLVLASVVVLEVVLLRDDIATDVRLLLDAGRRGSTSSAASERDGLPIEPPAPAAAGSVTGVDLRPLARCAPNAPCTVRLQVRLVPAAEPRDVTWSYRIIDRCTGATQTAPGGTVAVPPQGEQAVAVGTVVLPDVPAVALVAVTDLPAAAASAPTSVGSCLADRPAG